MKPRLTEHELVALYRASIDTLYCYVSRRCGGDRQLAEDIVQETWLRAVRDWNLNGVPDNPPAWLHAVARNLLLNHLRRAEPLSLDSMNAESVVAAVERDEASDSTELMALMNLAMHKLPQHEAQLLEDFHFRKQRMAQIAAAHGISERAVEGRLRRARERLRHELELLLPTADGGLA